jgi:hypothetical protein
MLSVGLRPNPNRDKYLFLEFWSEGGFEQKKRIKIKCFIFYFFSLISNINS